MRTSQNTKADKGLTCLDPSLTVPDQSLSLRELLTNYTRGHELPQNKAIPMYNENEFYPDIKKMDLVDIQELAQTNASKAGELKKQLEDYKKPKPIVINNEPPKPIED